MTPPAGPAADAAGPATGGRTLRSGFDRAMSIRATDQAIAGIKELISSGEFTAGARIPTERELTQRFGVSRSSLREAVRALALVGVLEPRVGDGTYVTTLEPDMLLMGVGFVSDLIGGSSLLELHRVRRILEPEATRLATHRLTEDDLDRLAACLQQMESADTVQAYIEADAAFHRVILAACGNPTLASLVENMSSSTTRARLWQSLISRDAVEATIASHRSIHKALIARDAEMAGAADVLHLAIAEEWLRTIIEGGGRDADTPVASERRLDSALGRAADESTQQRALRDDEDHRDRQGRDERRERHARVVTT